MLAKQDQDAFNTESNQALKDALRGSSKIVLHVDNPRDLGSVHYMIQVR